MRALFRWLRPLFQRSEVEREMDAELRFHFDRVVEEFRNNGLSLEEARRRARLEFGGLEQVKDEAREARLTDRVQRLWRGFRLAARNLRRNPAFTFVAVATLALGIGVNTLMFSLLDQLVLRSLPVRDPQRLVLLHGNFITPGMYRGSTRKVSFSWPKYLDFRDRCDVFSGVAARHAISASVEYGGAAETVGAELVSGNFFDVLGVSPAAGRLFNQQDATSLMGNPLVVLGHSYWRSRFAGDPSIVGKQIHVNGLAVTVIGVSAAGFHSVDRGEDIQVRLPITMKNLLTPEWAGMGDRNWAWVTMVARLKPGLSLRQAESGANVFYRQVLEEEAKSLPAGYTHRADYVNDRLDLLPASGGMMDQFDSQKAFLMELMGISGVVLLIACVNLAALLMARTQNRRRELAIRLALGAGRAGVVRQLLGESLLLTAAGAIMGVALALAFSGSVANVLLPDNSGWIETRLDWRMLLFAVSVTAFTSVLFSIVPALQLRRLELADVLRAESGGTGPLRWRKAMVAAQLSLCIWLMMAAGLFARSLLQLRAVDLGFRADHLITFSLHPVGSGYTWEAAAAADRRVIDTLSTLPGVTAVGSADYGLLVGGLDIEPVKVEGYRPAPPDETSEVGHVMVSRGYLRAAGSRLLAGRDLEDADFRPPMRIALVNQAFVRKFFAGRDPVGRMIEFRGHQPPQIQVVGVIENQRHEGPAEDVRPVFYEPTLQSPRMQFYVRTSQSPEAMLSTVRRVIYQQAPGVPPDNLSTMEDYFDEAIGSNTSIAALASFFGVLATLLAAIGLYGVMAYNVGRRTREIGIRMALGAGQSDVLRMIVREGAIVIAAGLAIGLPSALAVAQILRTQLYRVSPVDYPAAIVAVVMVAGVALLAGLLPARRATRVNPVRALRWD